MKLERKYIEKPWGRAHLPPSFAAPAGQRIGEVWFEGTGELPLLAKYIFTSERLSVQVHPDDEQALAKGLPQGKSECWYILDAEPHATLGLGLVRETSPEQLRESALDGSIEELVHWQPVRAGDFFSVPAGTVHAIGAGISLLEFQQNSDVTYRLYDYGRPRELHLTDAVEVARPAPYPANLSQHVERDEDRILIEGPHFILVHCHSDHLSNRRRWVIPLEGEVRSGNDIACPGDCLLVDAEAPIQSAGARMLIGALP